jgi:hypothetical protein
MGEGLKAIIALATSITGLAIFAVLVSKNSSTVQVIQAASNAYTSALAEAVSPITSSAS